MRRYGWMAALGVVVLLAAFVFWPKPAEMGAPRFFNDQTYNFEAIRVFSNNAPFGGDVGEPSRAIEKIKVSDADSWFNAWDAEGNAALAFAAQTQDPINKGNAMIRAFDYYRSAEFFLQPNDSRRPVEWKKNTSAFYNGLNTLGVKYERITAPYGQHHLNAVYYPGPAGAETRPLIVIMTGYDGTMEELYAQFGRAAYEHGYSLLTYEGPGQGSVLREQGLTFTPEWEKPNGAVLDAFLANHPKPAKIVLIGESMGGYLAPRAAAFDSRIDGVVAYDVYFDGYAVAARNVPKFAFWLHDHHWDGTLNLLARLHNDTGGNWAQMNGMWTLGAKTPFGVLDAFKPYTLAPVASRIHQDVLLMAGADDHFVPPDQMGKMQKALTGARSVTAITFSHESGGGEHCQVGASALWQATIFDWIKAKFG